jgi:hypothetical protein
MTYTEFSKKLSKNLDSSLLTINGDEHPQYGHGIKIVRRGKTGDDHAMVYFNGGSPKVVNHGLKLQRLALVNQAVVNTLN